MTDPETAVKPTGWLILDVGQMCPFITKGRLDELTGDEVEHIGTHLCGAEPAYEVVDATGQRSVVCHEHAGWLRADPCMTRLPYVITTLRVTQ